MKRALITGALGQDGRYIANLLTEKHYEVLGISSQSSENITRKSDVDKLVKDFLPHEIYHLAAVHNSSQDSIEPSDKEFQRISCLVNTESTRNLLDAVHIYCPDARLFYAASSLLFENTKTKRLVVDETTPFCPRSSYAKTKLASLKLCEEFRREKRIFASCGILFNHESPLRPSNFVSTKIVRTAIDIQQGNTDKLVLGDIHSELDIGFAGDYADAMYRILQARESGNFVVATGETHSIIDFLKETFNQLSLDWKKYVIEDPLLLTRRRSGVLVGNYSKLNVATGWSPSVSFPELIRLMIEAYSHT